MKIISTFLLLLLSILFITDNNNNNNHRAAAAGNLTFPPLVSLVATTIGSGGFAFGTGEVNPGAQVPFGCMRLGPDTSLGLEPLNFAAENYGGYWYHDTHIEGFSHTHMVGAGAGDYQNFLVTAVRIDKKSALEPPPTNNFFPPSSLIQNAGYKSAFSHATEIAKPGYYAVNLDTPDVFAEVTTAGTHSGIHRYTCAHSDTETCALVFDICRAASAGYFGPYDKRCKSAQIYNWTLDPVTRSKFTLSATMTMAGGLTGRAPRNGGAVIYFFAELMLSEEAAGSGVTFSSRVYTWENDQYSSSTAPQGSQPTPTTSGSLGLIIVANNSDTASYNPFPTEFILRTGISFISAEYAMQNMYHEQRRQNESDGYKMMHFDAIAARTINVWENLLSKVTISAPTNAFSEPAGVFYSLIYRTHMAPTTFSEFDGSYIGMDYNIHNVKTDNPELQQEAFYTDLSIWDIYRSDVAWQFFTSPARVHDIALSMLQMQQQYQLPPMNRPCKLPKWPIANIESGCMVGSHSSSVILDAVNKNISWLSGKNPKTFEHAFDIVAQCILDEVQSSMPAPGYYVVNDAGTTLEFAIDAGTVLYAARRNNKNITVANIIRPYAEDSYKNLFDMAYKIPCPRTTSDPTNQSNFDCPTVFGKVVDWIPYPVESRYVEASAVDSRWIAPQDLDGLFNLLGGAEASAVSLESFFYNTFNVWPIKNTSFENSWFEVENEPTMLTPYLFCMMGPQYASRTSYWMQKILATNYYYGPGGVGGNIDFGGLDAFAMFGYLGIYPVIPTTNYTVFTPIFDRVTIDSFPTSSGSSSSSMSGMSGMNLTILCSNRTAGVAVNYVSSVKLNGKDIGSRAWFSHEELMQGVGASRVAVIEMILSPVPVTIGNPNIPPFLPGATDFSVSDNEKQEIESILNAMMKQYNDQQRKKGMTGKAARQKRFSN